MIALTIPDQIDGVRYALARLSAEAERAHAVAGAEELAVMRRAIGQLRGALLTLEWIGRNRRGCVKFLTTRVASPEACS